MKSKRALKILFLLFSFMSVTVVFSQTDLEKVQENIVKNILEKEKNHITDDKIKAIIDKGEFDGKWKFLWSDLDYENKKEEASQKHLNRTRLLAAAFLNGGKKYKGQWAGFNVCRAALNYWVDEYGKKKLVSDNWWNNEIGYHKYLGEIVVMLFDKNNKYLSGLNGIGKKIKDLKDTYPLSPYEDDPKYLYQDLTGANKTDIIVYKLVPKAILLGDDNLMTEITKAFADEIKFTPGGEGLQNDYSFLQHGSQLYISGYGGEFLKGAYRWYWFEGTKYAVPEDKKKIVNNFFFDVYISTMRGKYIDFNVEGRGIARRNNLDREGFVRDILSDVKKDALTSATYSATITQIEARVSGQEPPSFGIEPKHIYFWKGDYTIHKRPKYSFNVRAVSDRTIRTEKGNGENVLGRILSDGSTNIQVDGDEYFNIMPVWEWDKIPGVTSRNYDVDKEIEEADWGKTSGSTTFVGGVSDGKYGTTVYTQAYDNVKAKKAYFFFDEAVVCLGSDITSVGSEHIITTINQTLSKGKVYALEGGKLTEVSNTEKTLKVDAIWHNKVAYVFPDKSSLKLTNKDETGNWNRISKREISATEKVFKLWIEHGKSISEKTYQYVVVAGTEEAEFVNSNKYVNDNIEIIKNDSKIQAVRDKRLKITQIVFYEPSTLTWGDEKITVNKACVLQLKGVSEEKIFIDIADPTQSENDIEVKYTNTKSKKVGNNTVTLPSEDDAGKTVSVEISLTKDNDPNESTDSTIDISAEKDPVIITNAISPNGDFMNEFWTIVDIEKYPNNTVKIFDKKGNLVFSQNNYKNDWRGVGSNGKILPQGSYIYSVILGDEENHTYEGWLYINY